MSLRTFKVFFESYDKFYQLAAENDEPVALNPAVVAISATERADLTRNPISSSRGGLNEYDDE